MSVYLSPDLVMMLQIGGMGLFVSLSITGFARLGGLGDVPDHRSSHARMTPTAGGLGLVAGIGAAILIAALFYPDSFFARSGSSETLATLLSLAFAVAFLGLLDDRYVLPARLKFGLLLVFCAFAADAVGAVTRLPFQDGHIDLLAWSGMAGTILWLFTVTNAVNFMDGINGLFGLSMMIASAALCGLAIKVGAPVTAMLSGGIAASLLGFLPYNLRPKAAVFSGDCGSLSVAFLYAGAVLLLVQEQPDLRLLYAGPLLILPLLADVLVTLLRKPMRGLGLLQAHNTHIYQRWARQRGGHMGVTLIYGAMALIMAGVVHVGFDKGALGSLIGLLLLSGLFISLYVLRSASLPR